MKSIFIFSFLILGFLTKAQNFYQPSSSEIASLPAWAQEMYAENPNINTVDSLYKNYYSSNAYEKNYHTQYYKRWKKTIAKNPDSNGFIVPFDPNQFNPIHNNAQRIGNSPWELLGPMKMYDTNGNKTGVQTNVYCINENINNPNVLYCGTEPGDIFKSIDGGNNWICVSFSLSTGSIGAIASDPANENIVFAGTNGYILKSTNGGASWTTSLTSAGFYANEIHFDPINTQNIFVASDNGFFTSTNGGATWNQIYGDKCYDVKTKPGASDTVYILKNNPTLDICEFLRSTNGGISFIVQNTGWYSSADPARVDMGGRLAVTPANANRIYAYLIGDSKSNDFGYIGIYKSNNGGDSWTLPSTPVGGPYTASHLNLAYGYPAWTYHQGYYNCAIMASPVNADEILVGGLNLYRSVDGAASFSPMAGYVGGSLDMHVDMQDFRVGSNGAWITNDGGIYFSNDFFTTDNNVMMDGVHGMELWGFDVGWNEDVMTGGAYHNGNMAFLENYNYGNFLQLGGAEPASGYVNRGENRKVVNSELAGRIIPDNIGDPIQNFSVSMYPNESYWYAESSEMEYLPSCYNEIFLGNENKLWKSESSTPYSFSLLKAFGTNVNAKVHHIEISRSNENVMYVSQRPASGSTGYLWKTMDGGANWNTITLPSGNSNRILIALSPEDENTLWIGYPSGGNNQKIYTSTNGGSSWTNLSTTTLNGENVLYISPIGATSGGLYVFTERSVYYRNASMPDWEEVNNNLPALLKSNIAKPFYRDGKIRIGTYGKGIWQNDFYDTPNYPIAKAMVNQLNANQFCALDTFYFEDHSMLNHSGASWEWNFPSGNPANSTQRNPVVTYSTPGTYPIYLTVTDSAGQEDSDTISITVTEFIPGNFITEGFQNGFLPTNWFMDAEPDGGQWLLNNSFGGYGNSSSSALFDNYNFYAEGEESWMYSAVDLDAATNKTLKFDIAFAMYSGANSDTLSVRISNDCGITWSEVYKKGGSTLATAPNYTAGIFEPTNTQWRTDSIDLSSYNGSNVLVAFVNHGYYGQAIYLDNINLNFSTVSIAENTPTYVAGIFPNPVCENGQLSFSDGSKDKFTLEIYDMNGKNVSKQKIQSGENFATHGLAPGNYSLRAIGETRMYMLKIIVQ
jgi:photosystem II stability/assembly factor-like uncharacterized protein